MAVPLSGMPTIRPEGAKHPNTGCDDHSIRFGRDTHDVSAGSYQGNLIFQ
jgi:hypothetical protein